MLRAAILFAGILFAQPDLCSAGVQGMSSNNDLQHLEDLVRASNNQELLDDVGDLKILQEKAASLREGSLVEEANALDRRIRIKV